MEYQFGFKLTSDIFNDFKWIVKATRCVIFMEKPSYVLKYFGSYEFYELGLF